MPLEEQLSGALPLEGMAWYIVNPNDRTCSSATSTKIDVDGTKDACAPPYVTSRAAGKVHVYACMNDFHVSN